MARSGSRAGGRRARVEALAAEQSSPAGASGSAEAPVWPGLPGGRLLPLSDLQQGQIHRAALDVLERTGMGDVPPVVVEAVAPLGLQPSAEDGRLRFPPSLVEDSLAKARRSLTLHGQTTDVAPLALEGARVHLGSGGAAPNVLDHHSRTYRASTLADLYDAARVVDRLEHFHFFCRSLVATDMPTPLALDLNTAFACLAGTRKHATVQASQADHVAPLFELASELAGGEAAFRAAPILSLNVNHVVPPLRFDPESCGVIVEAVRRGIPVFLNAFDQVGASAPAALAGAVVQTVAETLAGLVFALAVEPEARLVFGPRPMITDLRSGAMSGGSGEQAIAMAAAVQMGRFYDLPTSCIAGATDAKVSDAQSGFEKALTVSLAAHAGCNFITQAGGMQAGLLGASLESYVIDNDMLGAVMRSVRGVEVSDETLGVELIDEAVRGEGHFLGARDTLGRMNKDFLYPRLSDRASPEDWERTGRQPMTERAEAMVDEILANHHPQHVSIEQETRLRERFDLHLLPLLRDRETNHSLATQGDAA